MNKVYTSLVAVTCAALASACTDDASDGNNGTRDASVDDADAAGGTSGLTSSTGTGGTSSPAGDAGLTDASVAWDGAFPMNDAGQLDGGQWDGAIPDDRDADLPTSPDGGFGDAGVFIPDGGVVLRPTELPFDAERLSDLSVPEGFEVKVFATPGGKTRMLAAHGGAIYVTRPQEGDVLRLEDSDANGVADVTTTVASGYPMVHGIAFDDDTVYLATAKELIRGTVGGDGSLGNLEVLFDNLPDGGQHPLRTLGIGPDGQLYLSVGSSCDACEETSPEHATVLRVSLEDFSRTVFASGLRNTIGFGWHPETDQLWGMDNGSDWRGGELPPEELNRIEQGGDYGWPYCYGDKQVDPIIADPPQTTKQAYCAATLSSVLENQAHEAPIGMAFYDHTAFPEEYRGNAFVAMHGSWNRIPATGYEVVRVVFEDGQPTGIEDFVTGFLDASGTATFGRPAGITVDEQGNLLFSDDSNGVIYRVSAELRD